MVMELNDFENLRVFYQNAQNRRIHLSQIIVTNIGYAITLTVAIWGFFGKGCLDAMASQSVQQRKWGPWYLFVAALLSSIVVILWRWYTQYLDNTMVDDAYPKIVFCECELKVNDLLTMWRHFVEKHTSKGSGSSKEKELMELSSTERMKFVSELSKHKRYGCRGHNTINLIAFLCLFVVWTVSLCLGYRNTILLVLSVFGLVLFLAILAVIVFNYGQLDPSSDDLKYAIDQVRSSSNKSNTSTSVDENRNKANPG
jgi:hypothetical protein